MPNRLKSEEQNGKAVFFFLKSKSTEQGVGVHVYDLSTSKPRLEDQA